MSPGVTANWLLPPASAIQSDETCTLGPPDVAPDLPTLADCAADEVFIGQVG